jgi:hypothetical protein
MIKQIKTFITVQSNDVLDEMVNDFLAGIDSEHVVYIQYRETQGGLNNMANASVMVVYYVKEPIDDKPLPSPVGTIG